MDWSLFWPGIIGALVTVYLSKDEIIPEFRSFIDILELDKAYSDLKEKNKKTAKEIDDNQAKILNNPSSDEVRNLNTFIDKSQIELAGDTKRLEKLESQIVWDQIWRKGVGLVIYIFLGGVIGSLLADWVQIEGVSGILPKVLIALIVGASWTTYLSAVGLKSLTTKTDKTIEEIQKDASQTISELKKKVEELTKQLMTKPTTPDKSARDRNEMQSAVESPSIAKLAGDLKQEMDEADRKLQNNFDVGRRKVKRDLKGIL
jgi:peptidoglycan hydrolase CwlO-like protein